MRKNQKVPITLEIIIEAAATMVVMYGWQIIKYLFVGDVRPLLIEIVLSFVFGYIISKVIIDKLSRR